MTIHRQFAAVSAIALAGMAAVFLLAVQTQLASAQMAESGPARITEGNRTSIPEGFREWVFLGAPLTPNALNDGAAGFPEFHHVYIEPGAYADYKETGEFPEGTTIVKELVLLKEGDYEDGSRDEASGRGFFADRVAGIDMIVKHSARFAETNGWGFFNFGHHEPPYAESAVAAPNDECAFCHTANATHDMVFTTFYQILEKK
jgi:hypothetical protein